MEGNEWVAYIVINAITLVGLVVIGSLAYLLLKEARDEQDKVMAGAFWTLFVVVVLMGFLLFAITLFVNVISWR